MDENDLNAENSKADENYPSSKRPKSMDAESGQLEETGTGEADNTSSEVTKPDGGWGWLVCLGAFICNFVVFGTHNSFGVIYGTLIQELRISSAETGETLSILSVSHFGLSFDVKICRNKLDLSISSFLDHCQKLITIYERVWYQQI